MVRLTLNVIDKLKFQRAFTKKARRGIVGIFYQESQEQKVRFGLNICSEDKRL